MTLIEYYLQYLSQLCEGKIPVPEGYTLSAEDEEGRAAQLQAHIQSSGIAAFVRACARQDGTQISQEVYDGFDEAAFLDVLRQLPVQQAAEEAPAEEAPSEPVKSEVRDIYEVFLDSVCLDDQLLRYLIDVLKRGSKEEFQTLSHAAARTLLDMDDFMAWLGNKELLGPVEEQACVRILDGCFARLQQEGKLELLAALLSGDETTFRAFRMEAPELQHLPDASYEWFTRYYLDRYYPVRFMLRFNGVRFPEAN